MSSQAPVRPVVTPWALALVALPVATALLCIPLKREAVAAAILPSADGSVPLDLLGATWLVAPIAVLLLLLVTVRPDGAPRRSARAVALLAAAWLGTVTYTLTPVASDARFHQRTFGTAAPRVEAVEHGVFLGLLGVVGAVVLTAFVMLLAFRRPADLDDWSEDRQRGRARSVWRCLGGVLLGLLLVGLGAVSVT